MNGGKQIQKITLENILKKIKKFRYKNNTFEANKTKQNKAKKNGAAK